MTELETMHRAKRYMEALAQGIDPFTQRKIPQDSLLNDVRLARCFFYVSGVLQQILERNSIDQSEVKKKTFMISARQLAQVQPVQQMLQISEFTRRIWEATGRTDMKQLNPTVFTNWLAAKGFLVKEIGPNGKSYRVPTDAGRRIGISTQLRRGEHGEYLKVCYDANAQRFLLDNFWAIWQER